jgi:hypothetical protein
MIFGVLLLTAFRPPTVAATPPVLEVPYTHVPPAITGAADDPIWDHATVITKLTVAPGKLTGWKTVPVALPTEVKLLWDPHYLYVRFVCEGDEIYVPFKGRDKPHYKGDVVEVFIDPIGDARQYVEIELTPKNDILDQIILLTAPEPENGPDGVLLEKLYRRDLWVFPQWNLSGLRTATRRSVLPNGKRGWIADLALPADPLLRRLGTKSFSPMRLKMNFLRYEWPKSPKDSREPRLLIPMNWSPVRSGCPHIAPVTMGSVHLLKAVRSPAIFNGSN